MKSTGIVLLTLVFALSARAAAAQAIDWGIVGGTAIGDVATSGTQAFDANPNAGGGLGVFVGSSRDRTFGIHTEALFTWRRFSADVPAGPLHASARALEIPVLLRARVASLRGARVWVEAGPQLARIFTVTQTVGPRRTNISDQFEHVDAAAVIGGTVGGNIGAHPVMFSTRIVVGLRDLDPLPSESLKSRAVLLLGSYGF